MLPFRPTLRPLSGIHAAPRGARRSLHLPAARLLQPAGRVLQPAILLVRLPALLFVALPALLFLALPAAALAADAAVPADSAWRALLGLGIVIALIVGGAYLLKRVQPARFAGGRLLRTVAQLGVGSRERVVVVEIGDQWLVLGVTPQSIRTLHTTARVATEEKPDAADRTPSFAGWLARARAQRDAGRH